jgi:hypothetical protein
VIKLFMAALDVPQKVPQGHFEAGRRKTVCAKYAERFAFSNTELWPSGLRRTLGKRV